MKKRARFFSLLLVLTFLFSGCSGLDFDSAVSSTPSSAVEAATPAPTPTATSTPEPEQAQLAGMDYILNTNTRKFHYPNCSSVNKMKESNKQYYTGTRDEVIAMGYEACKRCCP